MKRIKVVNEYGEHIGYLCYDRNTCKTKLYRNTVVCHWANTEDAMRYLYNLGLQVEF